MPEPHPFRGSTIRSSVLSLVPSAARPAALVARSTNAVGRSFRYRFGTSAALLAAVFVLQGCATGGSAASRTEGTPSDGELQRIARSALSVNDPVHVRLVDGVAIVTGEVGRARDRAAVIRALEGIEGVDRVESYLQWRM